MGFSYTIEYYISHFDAHITRTWPVAEPDVPAHKLLAIAERNTPMSAYAEVN